MAINSQNEVFLNNGPKSLSELKAELQSLIALNKTRPVIVRADKSVVFDQVVQVLALARNSGVEHLDIAVEVRPSTPHLKHQDPTPSHIYCGLYHRWEKGPIKHAINLIKRYLQKKTDFATITPEHLKQIVDVPQTSLGRSLMK